MANGTKYNTKEELLTKGIQALVYQNDNNETTSDNIQKAAKNIVESLWQEEIVADTLDYKLTRVINFNDFTIRIIVKRTCNLNLELLPINLAEAMTLDDIRYVCYNPTSDGLNKKYDLSLSFNKLVTNSTFVLAGEAYVNQLHLYDNVGDISTSGFNYTSIGGTGNYTLPLIKTTGFNVTGTVSESGGFSTGGNLEIVFKGSLIGKL